MKQLKPLNTNFIEHGIIPDNLKENAVPIQQFHVETDDGNVYNLDVYEDGSFSSYGALLTSVINTSGYTSGSSSTSGNYTYYSNYIIYWNAWGGYATMKYKINYTFNNSNLTYTITSASTYSFVFVQLISCGVNSTGSTAIMKGNALDLETSVAIAGLKLYNTISTIGRPIVSKTVGPTY